MIKLYDGGVYLLRGAELCRSEEDVKAKSGLVTTKEEAAKGTIAYGILKAHNQAEDMEQLRLRFDSSAVAGSSAAASSWAAWDPRAAKRKRLRPSWLSAVNCRATN